MDYIYKIVYKVEPDYAKDGILSLSHPIFEFRGLEGKLSALPKVSTINIKRMIIA